MTPNARLYSKGIRTEETRKAHNEYQRERRSRLKKEPKHGIRQYHAGCRCLVCLEAHHHKQYAT